MEKNIELFRKTIEEIHGLNPNTASINDIFKIIHPEDLSFVKMADDAPFKFIFISGRRKQKIGCLTLLLAWLRDDFLCVTI